MCARIVGLDFRFAPHYSDLGGLAAHTLYTMVTAHTLHDPTHRYLSNNELTSIPAEIGQLTSLGIL